MFSKKRSTTKPTPWLGEADANRSSNNFLKICCNVKNGIIEYCSVSSIGGFNHLASHGAFHRICWFVLLVVSMTACYFTIASLFGSREMFILNKENTIFTSDIPFPAVTVCTTVKADHRKFNYVKIKGKVYNLTKEESRNLEMFKRIVFRNFNEDDKNGNPAMYFPPRSNLDNVESLVYELGIKEEDLIASCSVNKKSCAWSKILTPDGLCYAFNLIDPEEMFQQNKHAQYIGKGIPTKGWSYKNGYEANSRTDVFPLRGFASNKDHELKFRLQINVRDLVNSNELVNGFVIYIGHPMDYPFQMENRIFIPPDVQYTLSVVPDLVLAYDELKDYPLKLRKCFSQDEGWSRLKVFKEYSINNCHLECTAELSSKLCECVEFFIPRHENRSCGTDIGDTRKCYHNAVKSFLLNDTITLQNFDFSHLKCNCFPPCNSLTYDAQETMTGIVLITNETYHFTDVTVRFSSSEFLPKRRQESYSNLNLWSAIGGTLGLFVGASVISAMEFVYYFTIKIWFNLFMVNE